MKKSIIDHTYRDYSQTEITDLPDEDRQQTSEELFPAKLHRILNTPEYEDIIAWQPHGRVWLYRIYCQDTFNIAIMKVLIDLLMVGV